eukprot:snap_masked-scaffold_41-processed-gene-0.11-mRNA-1 protein AED:0.47 eAED:0.47 QI:0/0/0/0.5/1/1/2/0/823
MQPCSPSIPLFEFKDTKEWVGRYQRNNKRTGLKNLRCFPFCSEEHRPRGFCGRSVDLSLPNNEPRFSQLVFYGQFVPDDEPAAPAEFPPEEKLTTKSGRIKTKPVFIRLDTILSRTELERNTRTKTDLAKRLILGEWCDGIVSFNRTKKGWHYGWVANKHTCDFKHKFRAYAFEVCEGKKKFLKCVSVVDSPSFTIFCRRRQRELVPNLPENIKKQMERAKKNKIEIKTETELQLPSLQKQSIKKTLGELYNLQDSLSEASESSIRILASMCSNEKAKSEQRESVLEKLYQKEMKENGFDSTKNVFKQTGSMLRRASEKNGCTAPYPPKLRFYKSSVKDKLRVRRKAMFKITAALLRYDFDRRAQGKDVVESYLVCCEKCDFLKKNRERSLSRFLKANPNVVKVNCNLCGDIIPFVEKSGSSKSSTHSLSSAEDFKTMNEFFDDFLPELQDTDFSFETPFVGADDDFLLENSNFQLEVDDNRNLAETENDPLELFGAKDVPLREIEFFKVDKEVILEEFGRFLIDEKLFSQNIAEIYNKSYNSLKNSSLKQRKRILVDVLYKSAQTFFSRFGTSIEQFAKTLPEKTDFQKKDVKKIFRRRLSSKPDIAEPFVFDEQAVVRDAVARSLADKLTIAKKLKETLSGYWERDDRGLRIIEQIRQDMGVPWVLRKIFAKSDKFFNLSLTAITPQTILSNAIEFRAHHKSKICKKGYISYVLDGVERPLPNTQLFAETADMSEVAAMPTKAKYKAFIDYSAQSLVIMHTYSKSLRTIRNFKCSEDGNLIESKMTYELFNENSGKWEIVSGWDVCATRRKEEEVSARLAE